MPLTVKLPSIVKLLLAVILPTKLPVKVNVPPTDKLSVTVRLSLKVALTSVEDV